MRELRIFEIFDVMQLKSLFNVQPQDCACFIYIGGGRSRTIFASFFVSHSFEHRLSSFITILYCHKEAQRHNYFLVAPVIV